MSDLRTAVDEYLKLRRTLGFKMYDAGRLLPQFVRFAEQEGASFVTTRLALRWATQPRDCHPARLGMRLDVVRCFARYQRASDPRTEIPPRGSLPRHYPRKPPHIYIDAEIVALIKAAKQARSPKGLWGATYSTLFGLLAVTGMRVGESVALDGKDVDLREGVLTIRQAKFGKSRLVPVHPSARKVLRAYTRLRDRICPHPKAPSFFVSEYGKRVRAKVVRKKFVLLSRQIGLRGPKGTPGPRLHDFRHTFAVRTMLAWYRAGVDVERHMPLLSTYLGHGNAADTYWYVSAIPELLHLATKRLENKKGDLSS